MNLNTLSRKLKVFSSGLSYLGAFSLFFMMGLTMADVIFRYVFNSPILGVFELTEFMVLILIFSFLGYTQAHKTHVSVDLLVDRFNQRTQIFINLVNHTVCLLLMALIVWKGAENALELREVGETSPNLMIPDYPFAFFLVLGCVVMVLEYFRDLLRLFGSLREGHRA